MISEHKLASAYSSFWRIALPFSDTFTRRMNLATQTFAQPYELHAPPERAALVSELSFRLLGRALAVPTSSNIDPVAIQEAAYEAWAYISRFPDAGSLSIPSEEETVDALALGTRLRRFFDYEETRREVILSPLFHGCGLVDDCSGDILADTTLYEIKNVERNFRAVDIRQLIIYCALNYARPRYVIDSIGLVNGRSGRFYRIDLDVLAFSIAGSSAPDLFADVVAFISSGQASI